MTQTAIDAELEAEFADVAASVGCELLHAELHGNTLRVFLDRFEGGVTLADCESVSKQLSALLDVQDFGDRRYLLEVSSPGLDRQLYGPRDYERFRGHAVRVRFRTSEGSKRTVVGRLEEYRAGGEGEGGGEIIVTDAERGERHGIPLRDVEVARLEIEL